MRAWPPYPYLATRGRACSLKLSYCNQISNIIQRTDMIVAIDMACLRTHSVLELIKILFTLIGCFYRFKSFRLPAIPAGWKRVPSPHPSAGIQSRFHTPSLKIGIWVGDPDYWDYWTVGTPYFPTFFTSDKISLPSMEASILLHWSQIGLIRCCSIQHHSSTQWEPKYLHSSPQSRFHTLSQGTAGGDRVIRGFQSVENTTTPHWPVNFTRYQMQDCHISFTHWLGWIEKRASPK